MANAFRQEDSNRPVNLSTGALLSGMANAFGGSPRPQGAAAHLQGGINTRMETSSRGQAPRAVANQRDRASVARAVRQLRIEGASDDLIVQAIAADDPAIQPLVDAGAQPWQILQAVTEVSSGTPEYNRQQTQGLRSTIQAGANGRNYQQSPDGQAVANRSGAAQRGADFMAPVNQAVGDYAKSFTGPNMAANAFNLVTAPVNPMMQLKAIGAAASPFAGVVNMGVAPTARTMTRNGIGGDIEENTAIVNAATAVAPGIGVTRVPGGAQAANALGGMIRGAGSVDRAGNAFSQLPRATQEAARVLSRSTPEVADMRATADTMAQAGVRPTLLDAGGTQVQRTARAVGVRDEAAGQVLTDNARRTVGSAKGQVMDTTRRLTGDNRTASQLAEDLTALRETQAEANYRGPYQTDVTLTPETIQGLRGQDGQTAINQAIEDARINQNYEQMDELQRLLTADLDSPPTVSAGSLDRVSIALREIGGSAAEGGRRNAARGWLGRRDQVETTLEQTPDIQPARQAYAETSRAIEVAQGGPRSPMLDPLTTDPADFARWFDAQPQQVQEAARIRWRQNTLDSLGKQRANTYGTIDTITSSNYARENLPRLLGQAEADRYVANLEARVGQARNASAVTPGAGSRTAVLDADTQKLDEVVEGLKIAAQIKINPVGAAYGAVRMWLRTRGVNAEVADEIVRLSSDPERLTEALSLIESAQGPQARTQYLQILRDAVASSVQNAGAAARVGTGGNNAIQTSPAR